jgi:hypothetical protein
LRGEALNLRPSGYEPQNRPNRLASQQSEFIRNHQKDAEHVATAASRVVTRYHLVSDRHVNVRSTARARAKSPKGGGLVERERPRAAGA